MRKSFVVLLLIHLLIAGLLWAQSDRGTITGTVTDASGAVIPGVEVTATNVETGIKTTATSNHVGLYSILNLPVGRYAVSFNKQGFKMLERPAITLAVAQVAQLDVKLEVGATSETVTVTDDAPMLQTQTLDLGTNMKAAPIADLPLNIQGGRQVEYFAIAITPSVQGNTWETIVAGAQSFTKEVVIDGTSQNSSIQGDTIEASPTLEAVEEVQAQTSGLSAERGITNGGVINLGLKSGTNKFHGSAFGFGHNELLDANTWDNGHLGVRKPKARFWDYGFSAGGPIFKNKTFIFGAFERFQQNDFTMSGFNATAPTGAFLNGDFSALLGAPTATVNPCTGQAVLTGQLFDPATRQVVGGQTCYMPFAGNRIDPSRFSSVAKNVVEVYKKYYTPEIPALIDNNRSPLQNSPSQTPNEITIKIDHNFSDRHHLSGSHIYNHRPRLLNDSGGIWAPGSTDGGPLARSRFQKVISTSWRVSDSFVIRPNLLNVANATYNEYLNGSVPTASGSNWPQALGIGTGYAANFPEIDFGGAVNGVATTGIGNSWQGNWVGGTYIFGDSISWIKGRHTLKFGGELRALQINSHAGDGTLHFNFTNDYTAGGFGGSNGLGFASFLLGGVQKANVDTPFNLYGRRKTMSAFAQDDIKVNSKMTLNLGLRYQINNPLHEKFGNWANFDLQAINPTLGIPGTMVFAKNGSDSFERNRDWKDFSPMLGIAYAPTSKIVARGSFGIYYVPVVMNYWSGVPYGFAPGYRGTNEVNPAASVGEAAFNWDHGYPGVFAAGTKDPNNIPWGPVSIDPNALTAGYTKQWNFGVQYELAKNTVLDVSYIGNRGSRLHDGALANTRADATAFMNMFKDWSAWTWIDSPASATAAGVPYPYSGFAGYKFQAINPYPQVAAAWSPVYAVDTPIGKSRYDAFQIELKKRTGNGLTADFSYTLSKSTADTVTAFSETWYYSFIQDPKNLEEAAKTLTGWDQKHVFKGYFTYELPFGKGKRFLESSTGFLNGLVGGWTIGSVIRYNTGSPLQFYSNNYYNYPDWTVTYANFAPGAGSAFGGAYTVPTEASPVPTTNRYFDPTKVTNPAYGELGKGPARIDALRGFGRAYENASLLKRVAMGSDGRYKLQFRLEFYNLFNRHFLADPNTSLGNDYFGYVMGVANESPRQGQFGIRFEW